MTKQFLLIITLAGINLLAHSQTLTPRVICSGYGAGQGGGIRLNYTVGETFVTTLRNGNTVLTQGFHQPTINTECAFELANGLDTILLCPCDYYIYLEAPSGFESYSWSYEWNSPENIWGTSTVLDVYYQGWYYCTAVNNNCTVTDSVFVQFTDCISSYADMDGDGFGDPQSGGWYTCDLPEGRVLNFSDCDDSNPLAFAGTSCNDHNPCTTNDLYQPDCSCTGELIDSNNDGICDLLGCTDSTAFNYNSNATVDDGNCEPVLSCSISASENILCVNDTASLVMTSNFPNYTVGSVGPAGGVIYYDKGFQSQGWRYIEAAPADITNSVWGCGNDYINVPTGTALGTGLANSIAITNYCSDTTTAAYRCLNYSINGYDDWHLPSFMEFAVMHQNLISPGLGNFQQTPIPSFGTLYWTSSQYDSGSGWHYYGGEPWLFAAFSKIYAIYVRPVRYVSAPSTTYTWNNGLVSQSIQYNNQHPGNYTISCTVSTSLQSCTDSTVITINASDLVWYADNDNDGFGNYEMPLTTCDEAPEGYVSNNSDCNDGNPLIFPSAPCNDNDPCTIGDSINSECQCTGILIDENANGVCDATEQCANDTIAPTISGENAISISCNDATGFFVTVSDNYSSVENIQWTYNDELQQSYNSCAGEIVRTYIATDFCGNSAEFVQTIQLYDDTAPLFTSIPEGGLFTCDGGVTFGEATAVDNCSEVTISYVDEYISGACPQSYTIVRTWIATDACGNTTNVATVYNTIDNTSPVFVTFPSDIAIECSNALPPSEATAADNCTNTSITYTDALFSGNGCSQLIERTYTATDECGNSTFMVQNIYIQDTTSPVIIGDATINISCEEFDVNGIYIEATDNCSDLSITILYDETSENGCGSSITRHYVATDACGNSTYFNQNIVVTDTQAPFAFDDPQDMTVSCSASWSPSVPSFADNCDPDLTLATSVEEQGDFCSRVYRFIWNATDDCGNTVAVDQYVTVVDEEAPVFNMENTSVTVECGTEVSYPVPSAVDNCSEEVNVISHTEIIPGNCTSKYTEVVTYTASDICGNTSAITFTVNYQDTTAPVWSADNATAFTYECGSIAEVVQPVATDCSAIEYSYSDGQLISNGCTGYFVRSWVAADACGNANYFTQTISLEDTTAPVLTGCPEDLILTCDAEAPAAAGVTATDNCDSDVTVTMVESCVGCPSAGSLSYNMYTPVRPADNACNYPYDWAIALFSSPSVYRWYQIDTTVPATFTYNSDGTITLSGRVFNVMYPDGGFDFLVNYGNGQDWNTWFTTGPPSGYTSICGGQTTYYADWMYYIMQSGNAQLTGWGSLAGSILNLSHSPSNLYFGFELGYGAGNYNSEFSAYGRFKYNGILLYQGQPVGSSLTNGQGELAFGINNCPPYTVTRSWTAIDCSGNESSCTQVLDFSIPNPCDGLVTPSFNSSSSYCSGANIPALPTTSLNGITGTWSPAINNTTTTTYTFTPYPGQCSTTASLTIVINPLVTPIFSAIGPYCSGAAIPALPTNSQNGINGSWSPAINNTTTSTYTFTPAAGQCATTASLSIVINPLITPTFTAVGPFCRGSSIQALPATSQNGINGSWSPAINNTTTTTYTFTPTAGQCATTTSLTIVINPATTPIFNTAGPYCTGATIPALPSTSLNGINGSWSPVINNAATTTYTFTPYAGQCATTSSLSIVINPATTPTFNTVGPYCTGAAIPALSSTSLNGINGSWSPAINNTATTTYTFTPTAGQCATNATLTIVINPIVTPTFTPVGPYCSGAIISALPSTSLNGISGTWTPAINNTTTTTYTFTPNSGQCVSTVSMTIAINPVLIPTFNPVNSYCSGATIPALPTTSLNGITGTWSPALNNTATTSYTFTPATDNIIVAWNFPNNPDNNIADQGISANSARTIVTQGGTGVVSYIPVNASSTSAATCNTWNSGTGIKYWQIDFSSIGFNNITLSSAQRSSVSGPRDWKIQYRIGSTGTWTDIPGGTVMVGNNWTSGVINNLVLPQVCSNQESVFIRWIMTSIMRVDGINGVGAAGTSAIDNIIVKAGNQCTNTTTLTIPIIPIITPSFAAIESFCSGANIPALPTTSLNGISGTWSPAINNTITTTYTFTPNPGQCATTATLTIVINPAITPTFNSIGPYCSGASILVPPTSSNGVAGSWSPAINNTTTTTYTFTPYPGSCATTASLTIVINPLVTPIFSAVGPFNSGATIPSLPSTSNNGISGSWSPEINNTVTTTYLFTPAPGQCASTASLTIEIIQGPYIICPENVTVSCIDDMSNVDLVGFVSVANAEGYAIDVSIEDTWVNSNGNPCRRKYDRIYVVTFVDESGLSFVQSCSQQINVYDFEAPVFINPPADETYQCAEEIPPMGTLEAFDRCGGDVTIQIFSDATISSEICSQTIQRSWSATDACGNVAYHNQIITIEDTTPPTFLNCPENLYVQCGDDVPAPLDASNLIASDNCSGAVSVTYLGSQTETQSACNYTITHIYKAEDHCGNRSICSYSITVNDNIAPILSIPADYTVECSDDVVLEQAYAVDNCTSSLNTTEYTEIVQQGCITIYLRNFSVTDDCGNTANATQTITIHDTTAPVLEIPADYSVQCNADVVYADATAYDNCTSNLQINVDVFTETDGNDCSYTIYRYFSVSDECGNTTVAVQTITVHDTQAPYVVSNFTPDFTMSSCGMLPTTNCNILCNADFDDNQIVGPGDWTYTNQANVPCWMALDSDNIIEIWGNGFLGVPSFSGNQYVELNSIANSTVYQNFQSIPGATVSISFAHHGRGGIDVMALEIGPEGGPYTSLGTYSAGTSQWNYNTAYYTFPDGASTTFSLRLRAISAALSPGAGNLVDAISMCVIGGSSSQMLTPVFADNCDNALLIESSVTSVSEGCTIIETHTWTATDNCGNSTTASSTVTINDNTAPEFINTPESITINCGQPLPGIEIVNAIDDCSGEATIDIVSDNYLSGNCQGQYLIERIYSATDACGNSSYVVVNIFVEDNLAPVFSENNVTEYTYECSETIGVNPPSVLDDCSGVELSYSDDVSGDYCTQYVNRVWTATDGCGNQSTFTQNITVQDTQTPVISFEAEIQRPCDDFQSVYATATDNCDSNVEVVLVLDEYVGNTCAGLIIRTYSATDDCGNTTEVQQIISLYDNDAPVVTNPVFDVTVECGSEIPAYIPNWADNCTNELTTSVTSTEDFDGCTTVIVETYSASDPCGNTASVSRTITVVDTTNPVIVSVVSDFTVDCDAELPAPNQVVATDNCDIDLTLSAEDVIIAGSCAGSYLIERTYRATDDCGNQSVIVQNIFVEDNYAPVFGENNESSFIYECNIESVPVITPNAEDNCSGVSLSYSDNTVGNDCSTVIERTWTATDGCGNQSQFMQTITVTDTEGPVIVAEASIERPCDDYLGIYATATDNCSDHVSITYLGLIEGPEEILSGTCAGQIVRTYIATDACGNSAEFNQIINLIDEVAPVCLNAPEAITIECGSQIPSFFPFWQDQCDFELELSETTSAQNDGCTTVITTTYTATDDCGNVGTVVRVVNVVDTTAPVASNVQPDRSFECSQYNGIASIKNPIFTDNCDNNLILTSNVSEVVDGCIRTYTYTWTATDACGNATSVSSVISVYDANAPVFTSVPTGGNFTCEGGINFGEATAADECGVATITSSDNFITGACPQSYTIVRTWIATDECGNAAYATSEYTVSDNAAPVFISFPADATFECDSNELPGSEATAEDNCGYATIYYSDALVSDNGCTQVIERTYTATDDCGNATTQVQTIYIQDTTAPLVTGDATIYVSCDEFYAEGIYIQATDNCGEVLYTILYDEASGLGCGNSVIRHYVVTDECQNAAYFNQSIVVTDTQAPIATADPEDMTVSCSASWSPAEVQFVDNCDMDVTVNAYVESQGVNCSTVYHFVWNATDDCGNTSAVDQYVTVIDEEAPVFDMESTSVTVECGTEVSYPTPSALDNCAGEVAVSSSTETIPGNCASNYTEVVTYTASDVCGNTSVITFTVNHQDTAAPVWSANNATAFTYECGSTAEVVQPVATDFSAFEYVYTDGEIVSAGCTGYFVRSWVAVDACGNASSYFTQTISFEDTTSPVLIGCPADIVMLCSEALPAPADVLVTDNCDSDATVTLVETCIGCPETLGTPCGDFTIIRTWTAIDCSGNESSCFQTITLTEDNGCNGVNPGTACDDNNPCTVGDIILADCSCAGTFADADNDGTCDASDLCLGPEPGTGCDDNDPCTVADVITAECTCTGTFADADSDGTCDAFDVCFGPEPGSACDDGNPCTINDVVLEDCTCMGTAAEPQFSSESAHACGPYTWNNTVYTQSGTYSTTLRNTFGCDSIAQLVLTVGTPTFSSDAVTACDSYTWKGTSYTQSGTYTFITTNETGCPNTAMLNLTIVPTVTPVFNAVGPYCSGASIPALPTTSTNGIQGTWSPAINNTSSSTYTFTPNAGQCATSASLTVTINQPITPTFNAVGPYCSGASIPALPTTSTNGIQGTWSPAINNVSTSTYTFTPNAGQCATATTLAITINQPTTPTFNAVGPYCSGASITALPTTSTNGIQGTWSPALSNTSTKTYTFTPNAGQCATTTTLTITINQTVTPTFNTVGPYCNGASIPALPTTSSNGIQGVWSPALNNSTTTTYTFTPNAGQCATTTTLTITINPVVTPLFNSVGPYCSGAAIPALPTTSTNGIQGTWSPALSNTATKTYTFTPNAGQCATTTTLTIVINTLSTAPSSASASASIVSANTSVTLTVNGGSLGTGAQWKWYSGSCGGVAVGTGPSVSVSVGATTTYYVRAEGTCNTTACAAVTVTVPATGCGPTAVNATSTSICAGATATLTVQGSTGTGGTWKWYSVSCGGTAVGTGASISVNPTTTTTYFVRSEGGSCGTTGCLSTTITVNTAPGIPQGIVLPTTLCRNSPAVVSILNPIAGLSYFWQLPNGWTITGGQGTAVLNILVGQGNGQIRVYAFNSCGNSSNFIRSVSAINCVRSAEYTPSELKLSLWPNPTNDLVHFAYDENMPELFEIYDMMGRTIYTGSWIPEFDVSGLAGGIYFVRATYEGESVVRRMEVAR